MQRPTSRLHPKHKANSALQWPSHLCSDKTFGAGRQSELRFAMFMCIHVSPHSFETDTGQQAMSFCIHGLLRPICSTWLRPPLFGTSHNSQKAMEKLMASQELPIWDLTWWLCMFCKSQTLQQYFFFHSDIAIRTANNMDKNGISRTILLNVEWKNEQGVPVCSYGRGQVSVLFVHDCSFDYTLSGMVFYSLCLVLPTLSSLFRSTERG